MHYFAGLYRNFQGMREMKEMADREGKAVIMWVIGLREGTRMFREEAQKYGIPVHGELSRAVDCLAAASRYQHRTHELQRKTNPPERIPPDLSDILREGAGTRIWDEYASKGLLQKCGIPVVEERIVSTAAEADNAAAAFGFPVVLKGIASGRAHKTESGLVRLGITTPDELRDTFDELQRTVADNGYVLIQRQVKGDYELIAGFLRDDQFGPCVMFGRGGIFSEIEKDIVFAIAPLDPGDATALIRRIRGRRLLQGFRGMTPLREDLMADILVGLGDLGASNERIEQIDINPLVVSGGIPTAVDATIVIEEDKR